MQEEKPPEKPISEEANELVVKYNKEKLEVDTKMGELSGYMADTVKLADNKHEIYRYRQEIISKKLDLMTTSNVWNRRAIKMKSDIYIAYKLGKRKIAPGASMAENHQIKPKNDFERGLYLDSDMKTMNYVTQLIENQLEFIKDSLSHITTMCYGMEYTIALEQSRSL